MVNRINEQDKQWNKVKFLATKWRELEKKENDIITQIAQLELQKKSVQRDRINYMKKTRSAILVEVI